jgi:amino-acid N-acetyltransferase
VTSLRPATPADLAPVRALLSSAGLPVEGLEEFFPAGYVVAEVEGRLVGATGIETHEEDGLLRSAVVAPEWQGHGIGRLLAEERLAWAGRRGLRAIYLLTTTAAGYFPRMGFIPIGREEVPVGVRASSEFASTCPSSAVMRLISTSLHSFIQPEGHVPMKRTAFCSSPCPPVLRPHRPRRRAP